MTPLGAAGAPVVTEAAPSAEDMRFLDDGLYAYNVETTGIADGRWLSVFVRDAESAPTAGAFGWTWGGTCYIRYLFVSAPLRRQGWGTRLMDAVEREALARGCVQVVLETHDFQAPEFYRRRGFAIVSHVADYPRGHRFFTLVKHLGDPAAHGGGTTAGAPAPGGEAREGT